MQGYLTLRIFQCFDMRMDDLWTAQAQSQARNFATNAMMQLLASLL